MKLFHFGSFTSSGPFQFLLSLTFNLCHVIHFLYKFFICWTRVGFGSSPNHSTVQFLLSGGTCAEWRLCCTVQSQQIQSLLGNVKKLFVKLCGDIYCGASGLSHRWGVHGSCLISNMSLKGSPDYSFDYFSLFVPFFYCQLNLAD